jgi:cytochrome c peroxidase
MERVFGVALLLAASATVAFAASTDDQALLRQAQAIFKPLPKDMATAEYPVSPERVKLGRLLFFDPRISLDGTASCARCHQPSLYGGDALATSIGVKDRRNLRNAPTVLNAALQTSAHWIGDRVNVEDQATKGLVGPRSFGQPDFDAAMAKLRSIPEYGEMFRAAFPADKDPVTPANWGKAIGAYERTLVTPSPFDAYLRGDARALSGNAREGLKKFIETGCASCHSGVGVGGSSYQKFGVVAEYWKATGSAEIDKGRFDVTHDPADMYVFKVPSLRNVAMTAPYFHDGSVASLADAVRIMAKVQLGKDLSAADIEAITAYLESLTGRLPRDFENVPPLPAGAFAGN